MSKEFLVLLTASLPISELRGAIPLGLGLNIPFLKTFILSIVGNFLPVIPLLYLLKPLHRWAQKWSLTKRFFEWLFRRTYRKAELVEKYECWGLLILVAIPLPFTGAYTGCIAASLFGISPKKASLYIFMGIVIAGIVVSIFSLGIYRITHLI